VGTQFFQDSNLAIGTTPARIRSTTLLDYQVNTRGGAFAAACGYYQSHRPPLLLACVYLARIARARQGQDFFCGGRLTIFDAGKPRVRSGKLAARLLAASAAALPAAAIAIIAAVSAAAVVGVQNTGGAATVASKPHRPQEEAIAKSTRPYTDTDVSFSNDGPVKLAGTLSVPNGKGPFPAVLLIAASGPKGVMKTLAGISCLSCWPTTCFARESLSFATTSVVLASPPVTSKQPRLTTSSPTLGSLSLSQGEA